MRTVFNVIFITIKMNTYDHRNGLIQIISVEHSSYSIHTKARKSLAIAMMYLLPECLVSIRFILSFIYGLALTFYNPAELIPLMSTGKSKSVAHLFQRYLTTIEHIITWFEHYPFDKESKAYRSLLTVRQMHGQVSRKLNKLSSSTEPCWMNQHRMHNGQFAFIGLFAIFPKQV